MALRNLRFEGDPVLRKNSKDVKEITPRTAELIDDLIECVHEYDGVGLAAVQVGVLKKICVVVIDPEELTERDKNGNITGEEPDPLTHTDNKDLIIINPEITQLDDEMQSGNEGCLSVPGKYGCVTRPNHILLKAYDRNLKPFELEAKGLLARAICHETDHMYGIIYTDKVEGELYEAAEEE